MNQIDYDFTSKRVHREAIANLRILFFFGFCLVLGINQSISYTSYPIVKIVFTYIILPIITMLLYFDTKKTTKEKINSFLKTLSSYELFSNNVKYTLVLTKGKIGTPQIDELKVHYQSIFKSTEVIIIEKPLLLGTYYIAKRFPSVINFVSLNIHSK